VVEFQLKVEVLLVKTRDDLVILLAEIIFAVVGATHLLHLLQGKPLSLGRVTAAGLGPVGIGQGVFDGRLLALAQFQGRSQITGRCWCGRCAGLAFLLEPLLEKGGNGCPPGGLDTAVPG
jgi:hypothetical protein